MFYDAQETIWLYYGFPYPSEIYHILSWNPSDAHVQYVFSKIPSTKSYRTWGQAVQSIRESLFGRGEIVRAALGSSLLPGSGPGEARRRASPCAKVQFLKNMAMVLVLKMGHQWAHWICCSIWSSSILSQTQTLWQTQPEHGSSRMSHQTAKETRPKERDDHHVWIYFVYSLNIHVASRRQPPAPHRWALRPKTSESTDCRKKKREEFDSHV